MALAGHHWNMKIRLGAAMVSAGRSERDEVVFTWCCKPDSQLDPGAPQAPLIVAPDPGSTHGRFYAKLGTPLGRHHPKREERMDVLYERCCGLDIHKKTVVACTVIPGPGGKPQKAIRTFGTMTDDLLALADWLAAHEVTHVAMESTGVYWKPIFNLLEDRFQLL